MKAPDFRRVDARMKFLILQLFSNPVFSNSGFSNPAFAAGQATLVRLQADVRG
jgi:hypothetical protein